MTGIVPKGRGSQVGQRGASGGFDREQVRGTGEDSIELRHFLLVMRRNLLLIVVIAAICTGIAALVASRQVPLFRAKATIRLKNSPQAMTGALSDQGLNQVLGKTADPLLSEIQVLKSRTIALAVADRTGLRLRSLTPGFSVASLDSSYVSPAATPDTLTITGQSADYTVSNGDVVVRAPYGVPVSVGGATLTVPTRPAKDKVQLAIVTREEAADQLIAGIGARAVERTDVVEVEFTSPSPRLSQLVVNTAVEQFQALNTENARLQSRRRRVFIEEQMSKTDSIVADAQLALSDFQVREQVLSSREQFASEQSGLMQLQVRREEKDAERRMLASLLSALQRGDDGGRALRSLVSAPGVISNPVVSQLYSQLVGYRTTRDTLTAGEFGRSLDNPDVKRLDTIISTTEARLVDALRSHVALLAAQIGALDTLRAKNAGGIQALPAKEAEETRLTQRLQTAVTVADQLRGDYQRARIAEAVEVGQVEVVDWSALPRGPIGSGRTLKMSLGLLFGVILGAGAAFLRESLNTRISRRDEIEPLLGLPVLALIPQVVLTNPNGRRVTLRRSVSNGTLEVQRPLHDLVTLSNGQSSGAEAYRSLRTNLIFSQATQSLKSLIITSPVAAEGKTTTASNLAVAFAQQGVRVILVDGDLRKARLHKVFGLEREPGLADVLARLAELDDVIRPTDVAGLSIVTAGSMTPNPAELLGSANMKEVMAGLEGRADIVILDAAPVLVAGDASIVSAIAGGAILVVRAGQTERAAALAAMQQLGGVGARLLGVVLNDPDAKVPTYEGYYYGYGYYGSEVDA